MEIFLLDLGALSVPLTAFVRNPTVKHVDSTIADAGGWRLCAAIYHLLTFFVSVAWTTYRLPYAKDYECKSQEHREYLG